MRLASTKTAAVLCGGLLLALSVPASAAVDAKLLDMLKANGQITAAQYTELQTELANDQKEKQIARQAQQETNEQIAATAKPIGPAHAPIAHAPLPFPTARHPRACPGDP